MRCYIYLHRRLDTNEVFYIGRGTVSKKVSGKCDTNTYSRAFAKHTHNIQWLRITKKTSWSVEIIEDNLSWEESILSEIFYIKKYKYILIVLMVPIEYNFEITSVKID